MSMEAKASRKPEGLGNKMNNTEFGKYEYFHTMANKLNHIESALDNIKELAIMDSETIGWPEARKELTRLRTAITKVKKVRQSAAEHAHQLLSEAITPQLAQTVEDDVNIEHYDSAKNQLNKDFKEYLVSKDLADWLDSTACQLDIYSGDRAWQQKHLKMQVPADQPHALHDEYKRIAAISESASSHTKHMLKIFKDEQEKLAAKQNNEKTQEKNEED